MVKFLFWDLFAKSKLSRAECEPNQVTLKVRASEELLHWLSCPLQLLKLVFYNLMNHSAIFTFNHSGLKGHFVLSFSNTGAHRAFGN